MEFRPLGRTGLSVSAVSFGTGSLGGTYGPLDEGDALRLVDEVLDSEINFIDTAPVYGTAEARLGKALTPAKRDRMIIGTKAGRYGSDDFDYSPSRVRAGLERSLRLLGTDHVDILQFHDIEFVDLDPLLSDGYAELLALKDEGKCRWIGMTGYPVKTFARVMEETDVDVVLTYAKGTLLDDSVTTELLPIAKANGVGLINAAAVALGLLTPRGPRTDEEPSWPPHVAEAASRMRSLAVERDVDIAFLANQYAIHATGTATTVIGAGTAEHLDSAIAAADTPLDVELAAAFTALRPPAGRRQWTKGLPENN